MKASGGLFAVVVICLWYAMAAAVILHPGGEPAADFTDRPDPNTLGRWRSNASCVAVAPNYVVTTRHQGGALSTLVEIGSITYTIESIVTHPTADLRVVKLRNARLAYVELFNGTDEVGRDVVIGGFGDGRGGLLETAGVTYGYAWDSSTNTTLRWGTNLIDGDGSTGTGGAFESDFIFAFFDDPGQTLYECATADHDSGGGWFVWDSNQWKLAGLNRAVEHLEETWFRDPVNPSQNSHTDYFDAVRISSYAAWIDQQITSDCQQFADGDINSDCTVDIADIVELAEQWLSDNCNATNNHCQQADTDQNGKVDLCDFAAVGDNWPVSLE